MSEQYEIQAPPVFEPLTEEQLIAIYGVDSYTHIQRLIALDLMNPLWFLSGEGKRFSEKTGLLIDEVRNCLGYLFNLQLGRLAGEKHPDMREENLLYRIGQLGNIFSSLVNGRLRFSKPFLAEVIAGKEYQAFANWRFMSEEKVIEVNYIPARERLAIISLEDHPYGRGIRDKDRPLLYFEKSELRFDYDPVEYDPRRRRLTIDVEILRGGLNEVWGITGPGIHHFILPEDFILEPDMVHQVYYELLRPSKLHGIIAQTS